MSFSSKIRLLLPGALALLAGCSHDPMRYIPTTDRTFLEAQDRLGQTGSGRSATKISVADLLSKARDSQGDPTGASPLSNPGIATLVYVEGQMQPTDAQKAQVAKVAVTSRLSGKATVIGHKDSSTSSTPYLGERRAEVISRLFGPETKVNLRFDATVPSGQVVVTAGEISQESPTE